MITHLNIKNKHEIQNTPLNCTNLQHQKMGCFQISHPTYRKNTNIFKDTNIDTKLLSSSTIFCLKTSTK